MNNTLASDRSVDTLLRGQFWRTIAQELFTNTIHFPVVLILIELIPEWPKFFSTDPAFYALIVASLLQATAIAWWQTQDKPRPLAGNLIAPLLYTIVEVALEGMEFFEEPRHVAYWGFALSIGLIQELRRHVDGVGQALLVLLENMARTSILLVGYWVFEMGGQPANAEGLAAFLGDDSHVFIALATLFLGIILGFANYNAQSYLTRLRGAAARLRQYSEWLLGRTLLNQALRDPNALALRRQERAILFIDIRGFTHWAEREAPERVVSMLNAYFERGEQVWTRYQAIKAKNTGDEMMAIFPDVALAAQAALELQASESELLRDYGLAAGIGVHCGPVVEGVMGGSEVKGYDVVGDAVNTAKRICDQAAGGEVLVSQAVRGLLGEKMRIGESRTLAVKGKDDVLEVGVVLAMDKV